MSEEPVSVPLLRYAPFARVNIAVTTRAGGVSGAPYDSLNLATHTGDRPAAVLENRQRLTQTLGFEAIPWLTQVHGDGVYELGVSAEPPPEADAVLVRHTLQPIGVMTADCLPVVIVGEGGWLAVVHCGWRGLVNQLLEAVLKRAGTPAAGAWLGPCIGTARYEVGEDVADRVRTWVAHTTTVLYPRAAAAKYSLSLRELARQRLAALGVPVVGEETACVFDDPRFYSYRRDGTTGRFATVAWLAAN